MDAKQVAGAGAAVIVGFILIGTSVPRTADLEVKAGPSMLCKYPDGGSGYVAEYYPTDGGTQKEWLTVVADETMCVRRPLGGSSLLCRRGTALSNVAVGELNRFPANEAQPIVNNCERVACAVWFGEDADAAESTLLTSTTGLLLP